MVEVSDSDKVVPTADVASVEVVDRIHCPSLVSDDLRSKAEQFVFESHKQHSVMFSVCPLLQQGTFPWP